MTFQNDNIFLNVKKMIHILQIHYSTMQFSQIHPILGYGPTQTISELEMKRVILVGRLRRSQPSLKLPQFRSGILTLQIFCPLCFCYLRKTSYKAIYPRVSSLLRFRDKIYSQQFGHFNWYKGQDTYSKINFLFTHELF